MMESQRMETGLQQQPINACLPKNSVLRRWNEDTNVVPMSLFPGYVFVAPRADQFENICNICGSCGLIFVGRNLFPGRRVEVIAGPFMGVQGELVRIKSGDRLVINAPLLSSSVSVEVDAENVSVL